MPANKIRKKPAPPPVMGEYKHFLKGVNEAMSLITSTRDLSDLSHEFKRKMFDYSIKICSPEAGNEYVTSRELKLFSEKSKSNYHERTYKIGEKLVSNYHLQLIHAYAQARTSELEKKTGDKMHPDVLAFQRVKKVFMEVFYVRFVLDYFKMVTRLSNPDQKYYSANIRMAPLFKDKPKLEMMCTVYGIPAQKCLMKINGTLRPVFRLGKAVSSHTQPVVWISVNVSLICNFYKGNKQELDVYIQSHALTRLRERLDLLDQEAINYALWENMHTIKQFETYNGYLLLPFKVFGIKIGYLVANFADDKLLFRTFLFITHNSSPEGTRLRKITGLGKEDITYWHIDRLSTFVNLKEEKYPGLLGLFAKAGLGKLMDLKNKEFTIDSMQTANLDGLTEYINRGKNEFNLMNLDLDTMVNEMEEERII